jgi:hypothetical protein
MLNEDLLHAEKFRATTEGKIKVIMNFYRM